MRIEQQHQAIKRPKHTHTFQRAQFDRYIEPPWVSLRLFAVEKFDGAIYDPCAGTGTILTAAVNAGLDAGGADIAPCIPGMPAIDFLTDTTVQANTAFNPPYDQLREFAEHALTVTERKVAMLAPLARLNAPHWIKGTPLRRVWLLTPRPNIPPQSYLLAGHKPKGGRVDFCWLIWERGYRGQPQLRWLHRDGELS